MGRIKNKLRPIKRAIVRIKNNATYLLKYDLNEVEYERTYRLADKIIEDCVYEFDEIKETIVKLDIADEWESIEMLFTNPKSFCRLGDGEIKLIQGIDQSFQEYNPELAVKLEAILKSDRKDIYVGLNRAYFHSPIGCSERNKKFYRVHNSEYRRFFISHCNPDRKYIDAGFLTAYYRFDDDYDYEKHYSNMRELFRGRKVALVCGEGIDEKLEYDVFELAAEKIVMNGPAKNAFSQHKELLEKIINTIDTTYTICLILGMTAKIMVPELTDLGYMAWDIGHLAKDYNVYMQGLEKSDDNMENFWAPD